MPRVWNPNHSPLWASDSELLVTVRSPTVQNCQLIAHLILCFSTQLEMPTN